MQKLWKIQQNYQFIWLTFIGTWHYEKQICRIKPKFCTKQQILQPGNMWMTAAAFSACSTSFFDVNWNEQSIPLPHNTVRERHRERPTVPFSNLYQHCLALCGEHIVTRSYRTDRDWTVSHFSLGFAVNAFELWQKVQMERKRFSSCVR